MFSRFIAFSLLGIATASAGDGPVFWRSPDDMSLAPMYARATAGAAEFQAAEKSGWAIVFFYRQIYCVPPDFNLLRGMDMTPGPPPFAYQAQVCPQVISGLHFFADSDDLKNFRAPLLYTLDGSQSVTVILVPINDYEAAIQDNVLTLVKLVNIPSRLIGNAYQFREVHMPQPTAAGGGNQKPKADYRAQGKLLDGRPFHFHIAVASGVYSDWTVTVGNQ